MIDAAKERLCCYTEHTDEIVFKKNNEQGGSEDDEEDDKYTRHMLTEEQALKEEAIANLQEKLSSSLSGPDK